MCSVFGAILMDFSPINYEHAREAFVNSVERGRDSWGLNFMPIQPGPTQRVTSLMTKNDIAWAMSHQCFVIGNRRAEPTTEYVAKKTDADVQPFTSPSGRWIFSHNGTIANDKEICEDCDCPTKIDSYAIGVSLDRDGWSSTIHNTLKGSFAIVAYDTHARNQLYFATNYKPLFVTGGRDRQMLMIGSQDRFLRSDSRNPLFDPQPQEIPPYSEGTLSADGVLKVRSLYPQFAIDSTNTLAVCSGGLDSTVAAWQHLRNGDDVTLFHIQYGCRAQPQEIKAIELLAEELGTTPVLLETDFFTKSATSSLTDTTQEIQSGFGGMSGAEYGHEWVPARNTVLLALSVAYAEANGFTTLTLGNNLEESGGGYPDNEEEFINKWRAMLPYAVKPYTYMQITQPVGTLVKPEIVKLGLELGAPLEHTWSCYHGGKNHCGTCGPCYMRKTAFKIAGVKDPAFRHEWTKQYWKNCEDYSRKGIQ